MRKTLTRFFTIADFEDEEEFLRYQHQNGWKLVKQTPPCFFTFEACEPEDVIYRMDYKNSTESGEYMQMMKDFGWEYAGKCVGWLYFRKPAALIESEEEGELFSDNSSRIDMVRYIIRTRLLPLCIIFFSCVVPNFIRYRTGNAPHYGEAFLGGFFSVMFLIYVWLIIHCGLRLKKIEDRYKQ